MTLSYHSIVQWLPNCDTITACDYYANEMNYLQVMTITFTYNNLPVTRANRPDNRLLAMVQDDQLINEVVYNIRFTS